MLASILASGLAVGAVYALIGVAYNMMFSASRVMSFTAGQLGMLGGVFGSLFMLRLGMPMIVGLAVTLACCAIVGVVTEIRGGAAGAEEPRPASLRALDACAGADDPAGHGDRVEHRAATVSAYFWYWIGRHDGREVLAAGACLRRHNHRTGIALPPHAGRPRVPRDRRGQFRRPRARPAGAQPAYRELCAGRHDRRPGGILRRRSCCSPSSPMARC